MLEKHIYSVVLLLVYLDAACVYDTHDTELEKSWSFGLCRAIDRCCGPCMARLSVLSTFVIRVLLWIIEQEMNYGGIGNRNLT